MYATINDIRRILPPQILIGQTNIGTPFVNSKRDTFTEAEVISYINYAQQEIDGRLSTLYTCPLRRIKSFETEILESISSGSNISIRVHDSGSFYTAAEIRLQDNQHLETATIASVPDLTTVIVSRVKYDYDAESGLISILEYPDPIPIIAARLAVSYAFDPLFSAEQAPNVSEYGKEQRKLAINSIDSILTGTILLSGQEIVGRRFLRGTLLDAYNSPTPDLQFGREKS